MVGRVPRPRASVVPPHVDPGSPGGLCPSSVQLFLGCGAAQLLPPAVGALKSPGVPWVPVCSESCWVCCRGGGRAPTRVCSSVRGAGQPPPPSSPCADLGVRRLVLPLCPGCHGWSRRAEPAPRGALLGCCPGVWPVCTCWSARLCFSGMALCTAERARRPEPEQAWEGAQEAELVLAWVVSLWCEHGLSAWICLCVPWPGASGLCPLCRGRPVHRWETLGSAPACLLSPPKPAFDGGEPGHSW